MQSLFLRVLFNELRQDWENLTKNMFFGALINIMECEFKLNDLLRLPNEELKKYKLHLSAYNGYEHPLDVFARDPEEWKAWNEWRGGKDDFNREFILGMIPDYHRPGKYFFGGIFKVVERLNDWEETGIGYRIELTDQFKSLIGRLVVDFYRYQGLRGRAFLLENFIDYFSVSEILQKPYEGEEFPGYDNIKLDFSSLELLVNNQKTDWRVALENVKGIYLIVDKNNGKKYVGSAYGDYGIWSRWASYVYTGHGNNDELVDVISKNGIKYARDNFQFAILELRSMKTDDDVIINRESYWKEVLLTRGAFGYNKN